MEPLRAPGVAEVAFGLCDLVRVVRECIVYAAAVQVKVFAIVFHGDTGALDVPSRITDAPRGIPFQGLVLKFGFRKPENEIIFVAFVCIFLYALTHTDREVILVVIVEYVVVVEAAGVKVNISAGKVSVAGVHQFCNDFNIFVNASGRRLYDIRALDIQLFAIRKECISVILCDFHDCFMLALGTFDHLVLTGVRIGA